MAVTHKQLQVRVFVQSLFTKQALLAVVQACHSSERALSPPIRLDTAVVAANIRICTKEESPILSRCFVLFWCFRQLLGQRESIVAYTGNAGNIGSPCVDGLVDDGSVVQALTFDTTCQMDIVDNAALVNASVEVRACVLPRAARVD